MVQRSLIKLLKKLEWGSALACRLTKLTGKAPLPIHPKHLIDLGDKFFLPYLKSRDSVLDLGCHQGENSFLIAPKVKRVVGLDNDRVALFGAQQIAKPNTQFFLHDLETKLPFRPRSFTKVIFLAVLEHLRHRQQILSEIKRVLIPKGLLFLSVPNNKTRWKRLQRSVGLSSVSDPDHKIEFTRYSISRLLTQANFKIIKLETTAVDTPLAGIIDFIGGFSLTAYRHLMKWKQNRGKLHPESSVGFFIIARNER